jgi:hypothetical protein
MPSTCSARRSTWPSGWGSCPRCRPPGPRPSWSWWSARAAGPSRWTSAGWWPGSRTGTWRSCAASSPHPLRGHPRRRRLPLRRLDPDPGRGRRRGRGHLRARPTAALRPGRRRRRAALQRAPAGLRRRGRLPSLPGRLPRGLHPAQLPRPRGPDGQLERPRPDRRHVRGAPDRSGEGAVPVPVGRGAPLPPRRPGGAAAAAAPGVPRPDLGAVPHPLGAGRRPRLLLRLDRPDPDAELVERAGTLVGDAGYSPAPSGPWASWSGAAAPLARR